MIIHLTILENTKAQLIVDEISVRDKGAASLLQKYYNNKGYIVKNRIEK